MLIEARKDAGLTQVEVAERIGWTQTKLSKVERGIRRLDVVEFIQFSDAIGFDAIEMIARLKRK
jgi:transcriptional regulator with XRE-family HTH domain